MNKREIVRAALSAPSGDNCQPFTFQWSGSDLNIWFSPDRARHFMDVGRYASLLSLGCTIEAARISATRDQLAADVMLHLPIREGSAHVATVSFRRNDAAADPLHLHLNQRSTDRRCYRGGFDHPVFSGFAGLADEFPQVVCGTMRPDDPQLLDSLLTADSMVFSHKGAHQDLMRWLRLTPEEIDTQRDGMPWTTLGIRRHEAVFLRLCRRWWMQKLSNALGGLNVARSVLKKQILSSGRLVGLGLRNNTPEAIVEAGRLMFRLWVLLNSEGYGVQPLSALPLFSFAASNNILPELSARYSTLFQQGGSLIRDKFGWAEPVRPVWLFRTGIASPLPDSMRCRRFEPETVMIEAQPAPARGAS